MRAWLICVAVLAAAAPALGACGDQPSRVTDRALHRQWEVERDCAHPARPAHLVELPWRDGAAPQRSQAGNPGAADPEPAKLMVRPGMRVTVVRSEAEAELHLSGLALEGGRRGETVLVRAGFPGAMLRGVVVGPGEVELKPENGRF